jgi:Ankyrin repeats (3 copies)/Ankyrin repeats (many copies)
MNKPRVSFIIGLSCVLLSVFVITNLSAAEDLHYAKGLIQVAGAVDIHYGKQEEGYYLLQYVVEEAYPAHRTLATISEKLKKDGWKPLPNDLLNPETPSSHVTGWNDFVDATKGPASRVHQWFAQWKNTSEDIVFYVLRYEPSESTKLKVTASSYPAAIAKVLEEQVTWLHKNDPKLTSQTHTKEKNSQGSYVASGDLNLFLRTAAENGRMEMVEIAVQQGANINFADNHGETPLISAAREGHANVIKYLLKHGANINAKRSDGTNVLIAAAENGHIEVVRVLLSAGVDLRLENCGEKALKAAERNGHKEIVQLLESSGVRK